MEKNDDSLSFDSDALGVKHSAETFFLQEPRSELDDSHPNKHTFRTYVLKMDNMLGTLTVTI